MRIMPAPKHALAVGPRVYLRRPVPRDAAAFIAGARLSERLHRGWVQAPTTKASFAAYLRRFAGPKSRNARSATHVGVVVCKLDDDALIGVFNFSEIVRGAFESSYLGYYAFAPHAGQGYMSEGLNLALALAFGKLRLHRVEANVQPTNRPLGVSGAARGIHARRLFAPLRQDRGPLARSRALGDAGRGLAPPAPERSVIARGQGSLPFALAAALGIAACAIGARSPGGAEGRRRPRDFALWRVRGMRRSCRRAQRIGYLFRAAVPVAFNIHFHDGNAVIEPISAARTQGESGEFVADRDQTYCLMWEAGAGGSALDYRVARLRH